MSNTSVMKNKIIYAARPIDLSIPQTFMNCVWLITRMTKKEVKLKMPGFYCVNCIRKVCMWIG